MTVPVGTPKDSEKSALFPIGPSSAAILEAVRVNGVVARADLPAPTGLSQQSVHRLTEELLESGFLERRDPVIQGRGKPSPRLAVNPAGAYAFGVSVDTNTVETVWVDLTGNILSEGRVDVNPNDPEAVIKAALDLSKRSAKKLGLDPNRLAGCGISTQGFRNTQDNIFTTPPLLENWSGFAIEKQFSDAFGCPAYAENNGTLGAIAELWSGAGRDYPTFVYLSFNFGLGGGVVLDGRPFYGFNRNAGELTDIYLVEEKPNRPALQYLIRDLQENGLDVPNIDILKTSFDPAWPGVEAWVLRVAPALNQLVRAVTAVLDPAAIVFGGEAPSALRDMLIAATSQRVPDRYGRKIPGPALVQSQIPAQPSAVGAGIQALRRRVLNQA
ncbi:ROK family transcriptional regulator [Roseibium sp.]|uniref:ROK family transcriptional regulator n=1 Tax=Roseibium sp. TaxID=1936156 RepID=UPI003BB1900F